MSGKMRNLSTAVRKTINDNTDFELGMDSKNCIKNIINLMLYFLERLYLFLRLDKIPIFNPENRNKIIFNCIIVSYNCFYLLIRSLEIFFEAHFGEYEHYFHYIAEAAWVMEMVVQLNTSMYHHNHFTTDRKVIMKIYLEEYFFYEVLPLIFDGRTSDLLFLNILYKLPLLLKTKGILVILKNLEFYILQLLDNHSVFFLFKLIIQIMLFGHCLACAFSIVLTYQIHFLDLTSEISEWATIYEIENHKWVEKYLRSLYWAFTTMMNTQQYTPQTEIELAFTCICMIVSCVAFGYLLSAIGSILSEISKEQKEYKKDLNILNQFMKRKKIEMYQFKGKLTLLFLFKVDQQEEQIFNQKNIMNNNEECATCKKIKLQKSSMNI